ncbi:MAG: Rho-binding antiterminator [Gammaproteobacteria bacterium]|nr:Rho-binding antiterminator [Gammaproteobacteria bacterium]MDH5214759.1 Rho-binding antiterminator [Gammaproteobacteria bacterium]MDH5500328.1 Rho-binding antiterminator [Gammaproteobacteria bacterium]
MTPKPPIDCDLHDRLEVCCLYRYSLRIATRDGRIVSGKARTTLTDSDKREWLLLTNDSGEERVSMDTLLHLQVLTPGAKFQRIVF